ncbi:phospholipase C/P1 nuclease family protein [Dethiobacter alkaliphilus]|uniref:hypothetical protein n=1 Tax=Dethiobacter alkaliphilus TaxID=427926 RepID=UPI002227BA41|nr:hypothetical protein [Dethiobacter alkaliphilus]MCW3489709.1 hypothetical protein [Dethiobacter alkaliphilus]
MDIRYFARPLFTIENHMDLADHTSLILKNDGHEEIYQLLHSTDKDLGKTYLELIIEGAKDADLPFSGGYICHLWHFHHPWSHRGYIVSRSSADATSRLFTIANNLWQLGKRGKAIYHLGRALHLIQDIFIPHHAGITAFRGHGELEHWLAANWRQYKVGSAGYYYWEETFCHNDQCHHVMSANIYDWMDYGSHLSINWYESYFADGRYDEHTFREVAPLIVPNVLRLSAGFIHRFFSTVEL